MDNAGSAHDSTQQGAGSDVTADEARRMLDQAGRIERRTTDAMPPVLITYAILCVLGTMTTLGLHVADRMAPDAEFNARLAVIVFSLAWVLAAIIVPMLFRRQFRRGLATRWYVYMGIWAVLWAAAMFLAGGLTGFFLAPLFVVLFVSAAATEAKAYRAAGGETR